jgi:hypothetical protein
MGRKLLCNASRRISDHYVVIVEGDFEEKYFIPHVDFFVIIMW